ncbi:putative oxygen-independent coproporphyrinogen III oxidase [Rubidibacter lacunae KORDI 51-2]|uniref:Heme chaperone HemW n=1 Tax=Rubidibacter lacunae KORDI 51-2 TaxID=582515 RepID=U5DHN2_9CHRO|nr:radical SAM family heme chaperone HemW [Rubidibacter lacunae]ERN40094.1 putative oxygen-independent coproporphyrinogen III oxidase [Rubidibacter lacunae KORDI 51-2]
MQFSPVVRGPDLPEAVAECSPTAAYVHIPFCRRRCFYCDFPISVVGNRATAGFENVVERYVEALCREIRATPLTNARPLASVFFGGGTPSLLPVAQLARILEVLGERFAIATNAEIAMEIDPGTFNVEQLRGYRTAGVNRFSLGVQAFQNELLELCGRSHCGQDIMASIEIVRQVGITNLSLDLISGLPHQTLVQWNASLQQAIAIAPQHLSCYDLVLEPTTVFARRYQPQCPPLPSDETAAQMYRHAQQVLGAAGYEHYEIGNYARAGYQCRHNRVYWENRPYFGFGVGAASYTNGQRFTRPCTRTSYYAWLDAYEAAGGTIDVLPNTPTEELLETLMLGLRLVEGIDLTALAARFGSKLLGALAPCLRRYEGAGWVEVVAIDGSSSEVGDRLPAAGRLRLSDPEGLLCSNTVLAALFEILS